MIKTKKIKTPVTDDTISDLRAGDKVEITGILYTARDAAHKRLVQLIKEGKDLPFDINGQILYFVGPTPSKPGMPIGSAGPTTSGRMDPYSPYLIERGLKGMIGKGARSGGVIEAMIKHRCVYFAAIGGVAALLSKRIKKAEIIAFEDLGTEAIRMLEVEDFPVIVINDIYGGDLYKEGLKQYSSLNIHDIINCHPR
ncbi:MAG: fumarate hydratase [Nitrospirae bacterium GWA2_42_11]|nr:MAG: fumarate hydratase [Nitrospirae bacterium GWA2_42_11]HAS17321.1 Fe-S-containing hydro-lyase [Nitrospiraceae bacterium]